ncbi:MAG: co-chaperone DjlA [Gammaproteobacteria bacterium]
MGNFVLGPWWGKAVGAVLGFAVRGFSGALVGVLIGHQFDRGMRDKEDSEGDTPANSQSLFYATFTVMGHIAKSDGRVSEQEIEAASRVMKAWQLSPGQKRLAIDYFNTGKQVDFPLVQVLKQFREATNNHRPTLLSFVRAQLTIMLADHQIHPATRKRTWAVCQNLGITRVEMAVIEASLRAQSPGKQTVLDDAYSELELTSDATDKEVKTAYRRWVNRLHPDKLLGEDLTELQREEAKERLARCLDAYEIIKDARNLR